MTYGEGWHNNHHAYPRMARNRHKWWEFDLTSEVIRLLRAVGMASQVIEDVHQQARVNELHGDRYRRIP